MRITSYEGEYNKEETNSVENTRRKKGIIGKHAGPPATSSFAAAALYPIHKIFPEK